jgi:hypothetical protein
VKEHYKRGRIRPLGYKLSKHIARYFQLHPSVTSPEIFKQLTDEKYLLDGCIHAIDALSLLDSERRIVGQGGEGKLSSLENRCVNAIVQSRSKLCESSDKEWIRDALKQLSPAVLCELVTRDGDEDEDEDD